MYFKKVLFFILCMKSFAMQSCQTSGMVLLGTYTALTGVELVNPIENITKSDAFVAVGLAATIGALMTNNDKVAYATAAGLILGNGYLRIHDPKRKQDELSAAS